MAISLGVCCSLLMTLLVVFHHGVLGVSYSGPNINPRVHLDGLKRFTRQSETSPTQAPILNFTKDSHVYYRSAFYPPGSAEASQLWFDVAAQTGIEVIPENGISNLFRVFESKRLPFDFLFYGHSINQIAVTTAGFLYTSDYFHRRIYLTQYIAPLQADFNPSLNDSGRVLIYNHTDRFTVQWDRVHATNHEENGTFTFQVSLFKNGTIHFVYRDIPLLVSEISDEFHQVRVGLADSFYVDTPLRNNLILRQVYEYSRIELTPDDLSYSAFVLNPVPSCVPATTCQSCVNSSKSAPFECGWCGDLKRCSDGVDRFRQEWIDSGCSLSKTDSCAVLPNSSPRKNIGSLSAGVIAGISMFVVVIVIALLLIVATVTAIPCYGYRRPNSKLGLFMIEHRPKARSLNKTKGSYDVDSGKVILED